VCVCVCMVVVVRKLEVQAHLVDYAYLQYQHKNI
jgi:hypothetical protein